MQANNIGSFKKCELTLCLENSLFLFQKLDKLFLVSHFTVLCLIYIFSQCIVFLHCISVVLIHTSDFLVFICHFSPHPFLCQLTCQSAGIMSSLCGVGVRVRVNNFSSKTTRPRDVLFFLKDTLSIEDEKLFKACKSVRSSVC